MNLDEAQRKKVAEWISEGLKLSEIQTRLISELAVSLTYMEVRLLVDDMKLTPKDAERPKPVELGSPASGSALASGPQPAATTSELSAAKTAQPSGSTGTVSVSVDRLAVPGAVASGKVTFSDGNLAAWHLDQSGRLGFAPQQPGYRPPASDLQQFQAALETELGRMGF